MKPRILVFTNQPLPISETFVYNQTMRLGRYEACFLGSKSPRGPAIPLPEERVYLINSGGIAGRLREFGFKIFGRLPVDVVDWIRRVQPVLIHAHFGSYGAIAFPLAGRLGLPFIVSFHGTDAAMKDWYVLRSSYMAHRLYLLRRRRLAQVASRVIVQSDFLRRIVIERHGFPEEKVVMIRHGVDLDLFQPHVAQPEWGHILYVGRLVERKGLYYLLVALGKVKERFPTVRLTVIGDGPMRGRYEALARQILGDRCTFLGAQPQQVVREYMAKAYVFCMPSVTMPSGEAETLGMVFLEAMAMRVPPVSFRSGGIPEVILHGKTGFLAEERDVDGLAHYLTLLLESPDLRNQMGGAGRRWVEQEFNLETQNAKLELLYDEVTHNRH
jgi:colanic acid/amylovoran biosynthesis glycosyltransferase